MQESIQKNKSCGFQLLCCVLIHTFITTRLCQNVPFLFYLVLRTLVPGSGTCTPSRFIIHLLNYASQFLDHYSLLLSQAQLHSINNCESQLPWYLSMHDTFVYIIIVWFSHRRQNTIHGIGAHYTVYRRRL